MIGGVPSRPWSGIGTAAAVGAVGLAHTFLRDQRWAYEWTWASYQYQLAALLVSPVVALAAAWEGLALRRSGDPIVAAGSQARVAVSASLRVWAWSAAGYLAGWGAVALVVWAHRGVEVPTPATALLVLPALAQLAAVAAVSYGLGWWLRRPAAVPLAALLVFALLLASYVVLPDRVARIGGASSSLVGLRVPPGTSLLQAAWLGSIAVVVIGGYSFADDRRASLRPTVTWLAAPLVVGALALGALSGEGGDLFAPVTVARACVGRSPALCLTSEYVVAHQAVRARLQPGLDLMEEVGVEPPGQLVQGTDQTTAFDDVIRGDARFAPDALVGAWVPGGCAIDVGSPLDADLATWLDRLDAATSGDPGDVSEAEAQTLGEAAERLRTCVGG